ncbi:hypothetical protein GI582_24595 [Sulfitobacter sp. BDSS02]|nr:hypothetical protein [Sulfitobacter sp. BDSS02]MBR9852458.1 hypothetical protein [Paracoccaceae bacterium]
MHGLLDDLHIRHPALHSFVVSARLFDLLGWAVDAELFRRMLAKHELAKWVKTNSLILFSGISVILQNIAALTSTRLL